MSGRCRLGRTQAGIALLLVLWATALLTIIAGSFALSMRTERQLGSNLLGRMEAQALAEAAVNRGILAILHPDPDTPWSADGTPYEETLGSGRLRVALRAEAGKIDLNAAPLELLEGTLARAGAADAGALAAAIVDWRDRDHVALPNGAEDSAYAAEGRDYGAADGPFLTASEVNRVLGMRADVAARLADITTVFSRSPKLDPQVASRAALLSVPGLDEGAVDAYLAARLAARETNIVAPTNALVGGAQYLQATGNARRARGVFTIDGEGINSAGVRLTIRAIVQVTRQAQRPYWILGWREGGPSLAPADAGDSAAMDTDARRT